MRVMSWILGGVLLFLPSQLATAHGERLTPVMLDTDAALDDIRALTLLAQSDDVELVAVVTSDGASAPVPGARNVRAVLRTLGETDVPVAAGAELELPPPPWREMSESLGWSDPEVIGHEGQSDAGERTEDSARSVTAEALIGRTLQESEHAVVYLCLGPLTNLATALKADPSLAERVACVYYSGTGPGEEPASWNTARDPVAAEVVFDYPFSVFPFQIADEDLLVFDTSLLTAACRCATPAADLVCRTHGDERVQELVRSQHFRCWDEMVVLSLLYPELCSGSAESRRPGGTTFTHCDRDAAKLLYVGLLSGDMDMASDQRKSVVLNQYPTDPALLRTDIQPLVAEIIERHGLEEWNAALLACEFHRHLGIYSVLGVKMGIRAREILAAGLDELQVISRAGAQPPLSCLTDGLQVATGASLGRGTIAVAPNKSAPEAVFTKGTERLTLRLKPEVATRIEADIRTAVLEHGSLTPAYWQAIRDLALRYWLEMGRREIFAASLGEPD